MLIKLAIASLLSRKITVLLTVFTIAISTAIVLSVETIRHQAKESFTQTLSGTDLIVGARSGPINLMLYSVFRVGNATANISWESYQALNKHSNVQWSIPISLGDSHQGYRVVGTSQSYFEHYQFANDQFLRFSEGGRFEQVLDVVLGAEVAKRLGYTLGDKVVLSHGIGSTSFVQHEEHPFTVVGILAQTGTPVDKSLHVSLEGIEAIHLRPGVNATDERALVPKSITAMLVGLDSRLATFKVQRQINQYKAEPLMAVLPGVALAELWQSMGLLERVLLLIAALVLVASLMGMMTMLLATLQQRQREIAVLRAIGAPARTIFNLIQIEVFAMTLVGVILGIALLAIGLMLAQPVLGAYMGLSLSINPFSLKVLLYIAGIIALAFVMACIPAALAYRQSLAKRLSS